MTDQQTSLQTGVPVNTIRNWRNRGYRPALSRRGPRCTRCGGHPHPRPDDKPQTYCYLLGLYLGDGIVRSWGQGWTLRVSLDLAYPQIITECSAAITEIRGREPMLKPMKDCACVDVTSHWVGWPCLFPQHGPGRKHTRPIVMTDWQNDLIAQAPGSLLRGLIHSDGWRGVNKVHSKGKDYEYPRYQFSNRSDDIRRIFTDTCELMGIEWKQWTRYHVSVAKRESVALLDQHVGLKH